ncbi:MAG: late competence development ComFB family protein [Spirochaetaceae bacterium]|jgi:competence protein ComFB|nr:late competence development ComFB family protein [Spirochaetaceae bacterium]
MDVQNLMESIVSDEVEKACAAIEKEKNKKDICTCAQCRLDTACYALNRIEPRYIVSGRGFLREDQFSHSKQQKNADITALVYAGLEQVSHNKRAFFDHDQKEIVRNKGAFFNFPAVIGRIFDGANFSPMNDIAITLYVDGKQAETKDANWPNPCYLISKTEGTYTFWPKSIEAPEKGTHKKFSFSIRAQAPGMEPLDHIFEIPVISDSEENIIFSLVRRYKIADLFMFPPGGED